MSVSLIRDRASSAVDEREWSFRCDMAAVFRVAARLGWNEQIGNHNSLVLPSDDPNAEPQFLINARGYRFEEITASSLLVCDVSGRVLRGAGQLREVAFHIHAPIHLHHPGAACVIHVHPQYLTALSMLRNPELALAHHNNLVLNDRIVVDAGGDQPVGDLDEGTRIARLLGTKTILLMASHGVTVVGPTVADAFDECFIAERTAMYQLTAMSSGQPLRRLPDTMRRRYTGRWGDRADAVMHLAAWRRILDREEPDYAS